MKFAFTSGAGRVAALLVLGGSLAALGACGDGKKTAEKPVETVSVFETVATAKALVEPVTGTGTISAAKTTDLGPRVTGIIDKIYVYVGARVKEGDPLFHTRDVELKLKVAELENQVKLAEAEDRNMSRAFGRSNELHASGYVSNGGLDNARAAKETAAARLGIATAQLAAAKQQLEDCTVRAPFDGVITRRDIDEGKYMMTMGGGFGGMSGGGGGGGNSVLQIMKIDVVAAIVQIPEVDLTKVHLNTKAKVTVDGVGRSYDSYALIINDAIDTSTRTVEVRLPIVNKDYTVKPGLFVWADFYPDPRNVISLDRTAVQGTEDQRYVFVAENGVARRVPVTVRQIDAGTVEVLSGLSAGQRALSGPNLPLVSEGTAVKIETVAAAGEVVPGSRQTP
ncbi:MAG TPA: efflux RND transporter periplasmic adaptor subunit [Parvibaculum sp.]